jgi:hypothetical protein
MDINEVKETHDKILKGIALSYERLLAQKKLSDDILVFASEDGEIRHVRARDL